MNIAFLSFNNYYNRKVKYYASYLDYILNSSNYLVQENINFNPGDGVKTKLVVGKGTGAFLNWDKVSPDYLLVYFENQEMALEIQSRWFIIDENRLRNGQYEITLRRDVLADFGIRNKTFPIYVEKGVIDDISSPLLCNNESLVVNQIKKEEILLKDITECPWLVLYMKKGVLGSTDPLYNNIPINIEQDDSDVYEVLSTPIANWDMYQYTTVEYKVAYGLGYNVYWTQTNTINDFRYQYDLLADTSSKEWVVGTEYESNLRGNPSKDALDAAFKPHRFTIKSKIMNGLGLHSEADIMRYNGKIIKDSDGKYFRVDVAFSREHNPIQFLNNIWITNSVLPAVKADLLSYWNNVQGVTVAQTANDKAFAVAGLALLYHIVLTEMPEMAVTVSFSNYSGEGTIDSPLYDIIAMPYGDIGFTSPGSLLHNPHDHKERSLAIMNAIAKAIGDNALDLQLLPYCPCQNLKIYPASNGEPPTIQVVGDEMSALVYAGPSGSGATDVIVVADKATFTFNIYQQITMNNFNTDGALNDAYRIKYINDCTMLRLCSPNYSGLFDMNFAKNGCSIDFFNVDVTMRPHNPYIHVNPNFKFLYGIDFDDTRGLICNGDFSVGMMQSAWAQYEIQNKNYQAIFDRQIRNMDVNNAIARQEAGFGVASGIIGGTVTGAVAGGMAGGGYGAIAGAVVGAATSTIGGVMDYQNLETRLKENKDFAIDNFNLSLGNVKALPYSITKTSALTANNKLFPFVEIYECSDIEREAYFNKLKYDGMTIGVISEGIANFQSTDNSKFLKGQVIRLDGLLADNHIAEVINEEFNKGVYI